ncbi:MAG: DUF721 domain-containing protein [Pseudomonadales bacterium]|nr:DUF721 domain-containing protein [Pseudomonadales bacterium]
MKTTKPKPFSAAQGGILASMLKKAGQLSSISSLVIQELPKQARPHCAVGEFINGELCLIIENGGWSTAIRYQQNNILKKLKTHPEFHALSKITIKTRPTPEKLLADKSNESKPFAGQSDQLIHRPTKSAAQPNHKTEKGRATERGQFNQIKDPDLRAVMQELSKVIQPPS